MAAMIGLPPYETPFGNHLESIQTWVPDALHFQRAIQNVPRRDMEVEMPVRFLPPSHPSTSPIKPRSPPSSSSAKRIPQHPTGATSKEPGGTPSSTLTNTPPPVRSASRSKCASWATATCSWPHSAVTSSAPALSRS